MNLWLLVQSYLPTMTMPLNDLDQNDKELISSTYDQLKKIIPQLSKYGSVVELALQPTVDLLPQFISIFNKTFLNKNNNSNNSNEQDLSGKYDADCYSKYFGSFHEIHFFEQNNSEFVRSLSALYWKIIKIKFIDQIIAMFGDILMTPIATTHIFNNAIKHGADDDRKQELIQQLSQLYKIEPRKIEQFLSSNRNNDNKEDDNDNQQHFDYDLIELNIPIDKMSDKQILQLYGINREEKEQQLEELKKSYFDVLRQKEKAQQIIVKIKK